MNNGDISRDRLEEKLLCLGDPSGRQDSDFWDAWFQIVCLEQDHRSFEWYCDPYETWRVLSAYIAKENKKFSTSPSSSESDSPAIRQKRMIHVGSGTSLLPVLLRDLLDGYEQVVVDVSATAIEEMKQIHDPITQKSTAYNLDATNNNKISYILADMLKPPIIDLKQSSFDCWIDKGFLDAVFSSDDDAKQRAQSEALFQEAYRLLVPAHGFVLIISLAEDHSLRIILDNFLSAPESRTKWKRHFDVWEMKPISGDMRPFGFVFFAASENDHCENTTTINSCEDGVNSGVVPKDDELLTWHYAPDQSGGDAREETFTLDKLKEQLTKSRIGYYHSIAAAGHIREQNNVVDISGCRHMLVLLEIKPSDVSVDLVSLSAKICSLKHLVHPSDEHEKIPLVWRPADKQGNGSDSNLQFHEIIPIGFGVSKLLLRCIVPSEHIEDLADFVSLFDDTIQSVDIDWTQTYPVLVSNRADLS